MFGAQRGVWGSRRIDRARRVHLARLGRLPGDLRPRPPLGALHEVQDVDVPHRAVLRARPAVDDDKTAVRDRARDVRVARGRARAGDREARPRPIVAVEDDDVVEARPARRVLAAEDVHLPPDRGGGRPGALREPPGTRERRRLAHPARGRGGRSVGRGDQAQDPDVVERARRAVGAADEQEHVAHDGRRAPAPAGRARPRHVGLHPHHGNEVGGGE